MVCRFSTSAPRRLLLAAITMASCDCAFVANPGFHLEPFAVPGKKHVPFHRVIDETSLNVGRGYPLVPPFTEHQELTGDIYYDNYCRQLNRRSRSQNWQWATDHRTGTVAVAALAVVADQRGQQAVTNAKRIDVAMRFCLAIMLFLAAKRLLLAGPAVANAVAGLGYIYMTYPFQSAMVTCATNSGLGDLVAQLKRLKNDGGLANLVSKLELNKTLSCSTYGALICGGLGTLVYSKLMPLLFGTNACVQSIITQSLVDNFVGAPLIWLPPSYLFKALFLNYSLGDAMRYYWRDITQNKLLVKYWSVWIPAQLLTFSVVPRHLRVPFMACIGFCWATVLSSVTATTKEATA